MKYDHQTVVYNELDIQSTQYINIQKQKNKQTNKHKQTNTKQINKETQTIHTSNNGNDDKYYILSKYRQQEHQCMQCMNEYTTLTQDHNTNTTVTQTQHIAYTYKHHFV